MLIRDYGRVMVSLTLVSLVAALLLPASLVAQSVVTYNSTNGQLSIDTTSGVGSSGFNLVSVKLPGPQAVSIDRWADSTSQDGVSFWAQKFFNGAEQWVALGSGGNSPTTTAVPPGVYQIATYATGLTSAAFVGDAGAGIGAGEIELGGWSSGSTPGTTERATINVTTGTSLPCDFVLPAGCDNADIDALYAGTNGAPSPLTDGLISTWLSQASVASNPAKGASSHTYMLGDANLNGTIDSTDLGALLNNFASTAGLGWGQGNFNSDANVDSSDLGALLNNFGFTSASAATVPEPSGMPMFVFAMFTLMVLRTRER